MPKKSRQLAAKYAQKSRAKKSSNKSNIASRYTVDSESSDVVIADDVVQEHDKINYSRYGYVVSDLRSMGILIGGLAAVLIILTIILS
ncbi:hypothetical protein ACFLWJ_01045 [Chloroflexota bacterium]